MKFKYWMFFLLGCIVVSVWIPSSYSVGAFIPFDSIQTNALTTNNQMELIYCLLFLALVPALLLSNNSSKLKKKEDQELNSRQEIKIREILRNAREEVGLSQRELARLIEVTPAYVSKLENGDSIPRDELCIKLAKELNLNIRTLRIQALKERRGYSEIDSLLSSKKEDYFSELKRDERRLVNEFRKLDMFWQKRLLAFATDTRKYLFAKRQKSNSSRNRPSGP